MIAARIDSVAFVRDFQAIIAQARKPRAVLVAAGRAGRNELVKHFRQKNRDNPNKLGGPRQNFWNAVARSTQTPIPNEGNNSVTVSITDPRFGQKLFGGTIRAKRVRNLAIPLTPEAYGRSPRTFEAETGLKLIFIRTRGGGILGTRRSEYSQFLQVEYLLKPSVTQQADPTALPDHQRLADVVTQAAQSALDRQLQQPGGNNS